MLSIRRTYFWIFLYMFLIQIPAPILFKPVDELGVLLMLMLIGLDMVVNHQIKRYKGMFVAIGIMTFYAIYTLMFHKFNIGKAVATDFILQLKPFVPFFISFAIAPQFTNSEKQILRATCVGMSVAMLLIFVTGLTKTILFHVVYLGSISFISFLIYVYCSIDENGQIKRNRIYIALAILAIGLCCTRSKYYGEAVLAIFMLLFYKPGMFKKVSPKQIAVLAIVLLAVLAVSWQKISYYYLTGNSDTFDAETLESFARPALYGGMVLILGDYPFFGTGLASYATYSSTPDVNYSLVYNKYDLDKVFGLSEQYPDFICDAHFPELAQFGLVGIAIFIYFFYWIYQKLRLVLHKEGKYKFTIGVLVIVYVMIESTSGALFVQSGGLMLMMMLGMLVGKYKNISKTERATVLKSDYIDNNTNENK